VAFKTPGGQHLVDTSRLFSSECQGKGAIMPSGHPQVTIPRTHVRMLSSASIDQAYQIYVALPFNYADSDEIYPVLYVLDANSDFRRATDVVRDLQISGGLPELLIVGIGYPVQRFMETYFLRARDMSPTEDDAWLRACLEHFESIQPPLESHGTGGAADFLGFIGEELMPFIHSNYRANAEDQTIAGFSFGGLFALYTLLHSRNAFKRYIIVSPSLQWGEGVAFDYAASYAAQNSDLPAQVFMAVGAAEPDHMITNMEKMAKALQDRNHPGLQLKTHVFENETHLSVGPAALRGGLRAVFGPWREA
jgi:predicted alpha/beta superfamily hydrolase